MSGKNPYASAQYLAYRASLCSVSADTALRRVARIEYVARTFIEAAGNRFECVDREPRHLLCDRFVDAVRARNRLRAALFDARIAAHYASAAYDRAVAIAKAASDAGDQWEPVATARVYDEYHVAQSEMSRARRAGTDARIAARETVNALRDARGRLPSQISERVRRRFTLSSAHDAPAT